MTATYDNRGLKFLYPENWRLTEEPGPPPYFISLETPNGDAFWSVHVYPKDADPDEMLKETITPLQETYLGLEVTPVTPDFDPESSTAVEVMFYCLDFLVRARLQVVPTDRGKMLLWFQAEDREFDEREPVFKAIATSLFQSLQA